MLFIYTSMFIELLGFTYIVLNGYAALNRQQKSSLSIKLFERIASLLLFACPAQAQVDLNFSLDSPYAAVITHLGFLQKGNYHPEVAAKVFQVHGNEQ